MQVRDSANRDITAALTGRAICNKITSAIHLHKWYLLANELQEAGAEFFAEKSTTDKIRQNCLEKAPCMQMARTMAGDITVGPIGFVDEPHGGLPG